jgi:hypothetical protein
MDSTKESPKSQAASTDVAAVTPREAEYKTPAGDTRSEERDNDTMSSRDDDDSSASMEDNGSENKSSGEEE